MTEAEWLACRDYEAMLRVVKGAGSKRKFRLYAVACYRQLLRRFTDEWGQHALGTAERFAEGRARASELNKVWDRTWKAEDLGGLLLVINPSRSARETAEQAAGWASFSGLPVGWCRIRKTVDRQAAVCALMRDVFGNPFRPPPAVAPAVRAVSGGLTRKLARAAYAERSLPSGDLSLDRLAVLADALEDAGCCDAELLAHLRSPGPHVRGCWVLDAVLGKK